MATDLTHFLPGDWFETRDRITSLSDEDLFLPKGSIGCLIGQDVSSGVCISFRLPESQGGWIAFFFYENTNGFSGLHHISEVTHHGPGTDENTPETLFLSWEEEGPF